MRMPRLSVLRRAVFKRDSLSFPFIPIPALLVLRVTLFVPFSFSEFCDIDLDNCYPFPVCYCSRWVAPVVPNNVPSAMRSMSIHSVESLHCFAFESVSLEFQVWESVGSSEPVWIPAIWREFVESRIPEDADYRAQGARLLHIDVIEQVVLQIHALFNVANRLHYLVESETWRKWLLRKEDWANSAGQRLKAITLRLMPSIANRLQMAVTGGENSGANGAAQSSRQTREGSSNPIWSDANFDRCFELRNSLPPPSVASRPYTAGQASHSCRLRPRHTSLFGIRLGECEPK